MRICALMPSSNAALVLFGTWTELSCEMVVWIWLSCALIAPLMSTTSAGSCPGAGAYILTCFCPTYSGRGCMMGGSGTSWLMAGGGRGTCISIKQHGDCAYLHATLPPWALSPSAVGLNDSAR
jgi:hypothetical protein